MPEKYNPRKLPAVIDTSAEPDLVQWPKPPSRTRYLRLLVLAIAVAGVAYLIFRRHEELAAEQPWPAGWADLLDCAYMASLDGTKELEFSDDLRAVMYDKAKRNERGKYLKVDGTWSFDETTKLYTVTLNGESAAYSIAAPAGGNCVLVKGDLGSANLRESWFPKPLGDPGD
jgi:hypothetical protein